MQIKISCPKSELLKAAKHFKPLLKGGTASKLFDDHQATAKYSRKHYTLTLRKMEAEGKIKSAFTDNIKHEVTVLISSNCMLEFK